MKLTLLFRTFSLEEFSSRKPLSFWFKLQLRFAPLVSITSLLGSLGFLGSHLSCAWNKLLFGLFLKFLRRGIT